MNQVNRSKYSLVTEPAFINRIKTLDKYSFSTLFSQHDVSAKHKRLILIC